MSEKRSHTNWSDSYQQQIQRNIGVISIEEQEKLRFTKVAICGIGGLGGSVAEQLVRSGCEKISILDNDKFEASNLNRQLCTKTDLGKYKVDVIASLLEKINPDSKVEKFYEVTEQTCNAFLEGAKVVVLALDDPFTLLLISRACRKLGISMIESYGLPYLWAWWFTPESLPYESFYELNTEQMSLAQVQSFKELNANYKKSLIKKLRNFPGIIKRLDRESGTLMGMIIGRIPFVSFGPFVRLTASFLAFEIIFSGILGIKKKILAPQTIAFDYLNMTIIKSKEKKILRESPKLE